MDLVKDGVKERDIPASSVEAYATRIGADVFETSAKTGEGIPDLFAKITRDFIRKQKPTPDSKPKGAGAKVDLLDKPPQKKDGCCG